MAEETYGKVPRARRYRAARCGRRSRRRSRPRSLTLADPRVEQPSLQRDYLVPSFHTAKPGQSEALEVLAHILGGGTNSRLYRALVVDKQLAVERRRLVRQRRARRCRSSASTARRSPGVALPQLEARSTP